MGDRVLLPVHCLAVSKIIFIALKLSLRIESVALVLTGQNGRRIDGRRNGLMNPALCTVCSVHCAIDPGKNKSLIVYKSG